MKIYSIEEIVQATNNLYKRASNSDEKSKNTKNFKKENEPFILTDEIKEIPLKTEEKEKLAIKIKLKKRKEIINIKKQSIEEVKENVKKDVIVNELFTFLKRKIRKSTIKIILDQQLENNKLKDIIADLRKKEFQNIRINKKLKDEIANLLNNEKILNFKFLKFQEELKITTERELELIQKNRKLENDVLDFKTSINSLKETYHSLQNNNEMLKNKLENLIVNEKNFIDSNKKIENNLLTLTETKNFLSEQSDKLKEELLLIKENEKLLIKNNTKLQQEVSLLTKNKKILIDINDQYHEQINTLEKDKIVLLDEKISLEKLNNSSEDSKQTLIENSYKLKDQISGLIEKEKRLIKNNRSLEMENNSLKNRDSIEKLGEDQKVLNEMNTNLQYELSSLRANEIKLIKNNKKMHNELIKLRTKGTKKFANDQVEELKNLKEKVIFFQDENLRLSHDLSNSQKKYDIMKDQLTDIENEKSNISEKISELTKSIGQTNLIKNPFEQQKIVKKIKSQHKDTDVDLDEQIKKIFNSE